MNFAVRRGMTLEEFLAWDEGQEGRWEFDGFEPVAMVGGTSAHSGITINLLIALGTRLRGGQCNVYNDSLRVNVAGSIRYPDATVGCTKLPLGAQQVIDPVVVFEVLSPTTASIDLIVKPAEYRDTPSIRRYVILAQDRIAANVYEWRGGNWIGTPVTDPAAILGLPEIGISVSLAECYIGVINP